MTLTVHHLQISQSERIPWLCEELGVPYELKLYKRSPVLAPPEYKALHPLGTAPIVHDSNGDTTLAESCAIIEYICHRHGGGKLFASPSDANYADFLFWWHWADGSFMSAVGRKMTNSMAGLADDHFLVTFGDERMRAALQTLDQTLGKREWVAGPEFSAADVMVVFPLTTMRYFAPYSLAGYENILAYLQRVGERPAYQRAMKKGDPDMGLVLGPDAPKSFFSS
ncbi:glutathione S-transferase [Xylariaceae sp. FL0804]|nr:glutathione S-transferase [Xylariaceae sp. FL0804]